MKAILFNRGKAIITLVALFAAVSTTSTQAQGTVLFQNDERGLVYQWTSQFDPTPVLAGYDYRPHIQIAYAPAGTSLTPWTYIPGWGNSTEYWLSLNPGWTLGPTANMVASGRFDGGTISLNPIASGAQADYVIFAWGPGTNFNYSASLGNWYGFAGPFRTATGGGGAPSVSIADSFTGVTIVGSILCSGSVPPAPGDPAQPRLSVSAWTSSLHTPRSTPGPNRPVVPVRK